MKRVDLIPCPCCHKPYARRSGHAEDHTAHVRCTICQIRTPDFSRHAEAVKFWNGLARYRKSPAKPHRKPANSGASHGGGRR